MSTVSLNFVRRSDGLAINVMAENAALTTFMALHEWAPMDDTVGTLTELDPKKCAAPTRFLPAHEVNSLFKNGFEQHARALLTNTHPTSRTFQSSPGAGSLTVIISDKQTVAFSTHTSIVDGRYIYFVTHVNLTEGTTRTGRFTGFFAAFAEVSRIMDGVQ